MANNLLPEYRKGQKLFITLTDNKNLEGSFSRSSSARKAIILHNVSFIPFNGKCFEQLELKFTEILQIGSLDEKCADNPSASDNHQPDITTSPAVQLKKQDGVLYEKIKEHVVNHVFIDQIDDKFSGALKTLDKADCIAVVGQGCDQGRFGHLTILGVATNKSLFLFDIVNLGSRVFKEGGCFLKKLLETNRVLKVVHDCRMLSDCLKHKYSVTLQNVFDTQACHIIVVKNNSGRLPSSASFSTLISQYLQLPEGVCEVKVSSPDVWRRRPLEEGLAEAVAWRVAVLQKLRPRLDDALYGPFDSLCQSYLRSIRNIEDELEAKVEVHQHQDGRLPEALINQKNHQ